MTGELSFTWKHRRDTAANWTANNPVIGDGQLGFETDTGLAKLGDGVTAWTSLDYLYDAAGSSSGVVDGDKGDVVVSASGATWLFDSSVVTAAAKTVLAGATVADMVNTLGGATSTGSGGLVRATSPTLITPALGTPSALVATNATGTAAGLTAGIANALKSATTTVDTSAATAPTSGQVLTATGASAATWQTPTVPPIPDAGDIAVTPVGGVAATDVQAAIAELDSEKAAASHTHVLANVTDAGNVASRNVGTTAGTAAAGDDSRFTDDRTASGLRSATTIVVVSAATAPSNGQVLQASSSTAAAWVTPTIPPTPVAGDIDFTPAGSIAATDVQAAIQELDTEKQPLDTDLTAIAALVSAADKGLQSTGAGTWALYDLTTAGKALLDDANASAQRTTLGLGTLAVVTVNTLTDIAAGIDTAADEMVVWDDSATDYKKVVVADLFGSGANVLATFRDRMGLPRWMEDWGPTGSPNGWTNSITGSGAVINTNGGADTWCRGSDTLGYVGIHNGAGTATTDAYNLRSSTSKFYLFDGACFVFRICTDSATTNQKFRFGLRDSTSATLWNDWTNGVYFELDTSTSANWYVKVAQAGARTATDSGLANTATAATWVEFMIEFVDNTEVNFYYWTAGAWSLLHSETGANIPSLNTERLCNIHLVAAGNGSANRTMNIDYVALFGADVLRNVA